MSIVLRKTVRTVREFCVWAGSALPQDFVIYHVGRLTSDRLSNGVLRELAETVLLFQQTGFIVGSQQPMRLAALEGWTYIATRTGGGWAPRSVLLGRVDAATWRALKAIRDRPAAMSAVRAVRDELSISEDRAADLVAYLFAREMVENAPSKGYQISTAGLRMLV